MFERENLLLVFRQNKVPLIVGSLGISLILLGLVQVFMKTNKHEPLVLEKADASHEEIVVDMEGALMNPGVYNLPGTARMVDALAVAGGLSESADRVWVEKNINLAKRISDGLKIYIPRVGEQIEVNNVNEGVANEEGSAGLVNINSASSSELEALPGIGAVSAQKIIDARPYSNIDEILSKKVVGKATFEKIKTSISTQ